MTGDRGDIVAAFLVVLGAVMTTAAITPLVDIGDGIANHLVLYGAAAGIGLQMWRKVIRPILGIAEHVQRIPSIDDRVQAIDKRVGRIEQRLKN